MHRPSLTLLRPSDSSRCQPSAMNIDVHAHYVPPDSLRMAAEIGARHGLKMEKDERGRAILTRGGKAFLSELKAEFFDLDLRLFDTL